MGPEKVRVTPGFAQLVGLVDVPTANFGYRKLSPDCLTKVKVVFPNPPSNLYVLLAEVDVGLLPGKGSPATREKLFGDIVQEVDTVSSVVSLYPVFNKTETQTFVCYLT